jgi:hypothetical protein
MISHRFASFRSVPVVIYLIQTYVKKPEVGIVEALLEKSRPDVFTINALSELPVVQTLVH